MRVLAFLALTSLLLACQSTQVSADISVVNPATVGMSSERLSRIEPVMQKYIDDNKLAGTMTLIAKDGKVAYLSSLGMRDKEAGLPLTEDTIFRIYSMTKPVTAVAALILWEQGKFHMHDPISNYLPELKDMQVYVSGEGENMVTEKANGPIRIIDLFLHTAGFSYGFSNSEVDKLYQKMFNDSAELKRDQLITKIAELPLVHQPGTAWHYGINIDVLGLLVEKLTGMKLGQYMEQEIFSPLGMKDTAFYVPADKLSRFAQVYTANDKGQTVLMENEPLGDYTTDPEIHNAGGGLVSTMADYLKFAQMMLNGGELDGVRILGRKTVEYMRSNHLPASLIPYNAQSSGEGYGLAMSVTVDPEQAGFMSSQGNYGWGGMASTYFRIDPKENMILIAMAQFVPINWFSSLSRRFQKPGVSITGIDDIKKARLSGLFLFYGAGQVGDHVAAFTLFIQPDADQPGLGNTRSDG